MNNFLAARNALSIELTASRQPRATSSTRQSPINIAFLLLSTFRHRLEYCARSKRSITSSNRMFFFVSFSRSLWLFLVWKEKKSGRRVSRGLNSHTNRMFAISFSISATKGDDWGDFYGLTGTFRSELLFSCRFCLYFALFLLSFLTNTRKFHFECKN